MFRTLIAAAVAVAIAVPAMAEEKKVTGPLSFTLKDIKGKDVELSKYKGKVVVFVNVASKCGLTSQYEGLQAMYEKYEKQGLVVIGVPANEFGKQEPGTDAEIEKFCSSNFKVSFPMMSKIVVKGKGINPVYESLTGKSAKFPGDIKWNFEKFVVGKDGQVVARFEPNTEPNDPKFVQKIEAELKK
ncbi:MAG: glutathione peroxidase [Gemmataceae bacterium]|nr:glutathione peroxidase [Gemmataceae bacterium]